MNSLDTLIDRRSSDEGFAPSETSDDEEFLECHDSFDPEIPDTELKNKVLVQAPGNSISRFGAFLVDCIQYYSQEISVFNGLLKAEEEEDFSPFGSNVWKHVLCPMSRDIETDEAVNELFDEMSEKMQKTVKSVQIVHKFVFPSITTNLVIKECAFLGINYFVTEYLTNRFIESFDYSVYPITIAALYALNTTNIRNKMADRIGVSVKSFDLYAATLVILLSKDFGPLPLGNLPKIVIGSMIGTLVKAAPEIFKNGYQQNVLETLAIERTICSITTAFTSNFVAGFCLGWTLLNTKTALKILNQTAKLKNALVAGDLGTVAQNFLTTQYSQENQSNFVSLALSEVGHLTRAVVRSSLQYINMVEDSQEIQNAQRNFTETYLNPFATEDQKNAAKNRLIETIKETLRTKSEKLSFAIAHPFIHLTKELIDYFLSIHENSLSIFDRNKKNYTKELLTIHLPILVAFSLLHMDNDTLLTRREQLSFVEKISGMLLGYTNKMAPISVVQMITPLTTQAIRSATNNYFFPFDNYRTEQRQAPGPTTQIREIALRVIDLRDKLQRGDLGTVAQDFLTTRYSHENQSRIVSLGLSQVDLFTRSAIRSTLRYMSIVQNSPQILAKQQYFTQIYLNSNFTEADKISAKNALLIEINEEVKKSYTLRERFSLLALNPFDAYFEDAINRLPFSGMEENKLKWIKDLLHIHIRFLVAFAHLNIGNNTQLRREEQIEFIQQISNIAVNYFDTLYPDSAVIQQIKRPSLTTIHNITHEYLLPQQEDSEAPPPTPAPTLMSRLITKVTDFFRALFQQLRTLFNSNR